MKSAILVVSHKHDAVESMARSHWKEESGVVSVYASGGGLFGPGGLAFDGSGNLFVANVGDGTIREVAPNGQVSLFASGLQQPNSVVYSGGVLYATDAGNNAIVKFSSSGSVSTLASGGSLAFPEGLTLASDGNLYSGNRNANHLSKITLSGTATDFAPGVMSTSIAFSSGTAAPEPATLYFLGFSLLANPLLRRKLRQR